MPRTKVTKKNDKKCEDEGIDKQLLLKHLYSIKDELLEEIMSNIHSALEEYRLELKKRHIDILNVKIRDLTNVTPLSGNATASMNLTGKQEILNRTKTVKKGKKHLTRSSSLTDEGYLTTESSNSVGRISKHRSRPAKVQKTQEKSVRATRSLSRSNTSAKNRNCTTPLNRNTPNNYGLITPKCKPNTPQVLLRRPNAGEVALSFQGSPLLTASVMRDDVANINIPLDDGSLLSLLPQKGLRLSQIPQFNDATLKQLETLNQHIEMMLKAAAQPSD